MQVIINLIVSGIAVLISAYIIPGVQVEDFFAAVVVAVVLALVNAIIRPIVTLLTLPVNVVTLGLFSFVITALMVMLTDYIVPGFSVANFWNALLFGVVMSLINGFLFTMLPTPVVGKVGKKK